MGDKQGDGGMRDTDRERERNRLRKREGEKDIWQPLLKAFQKTFAVVDTFGSSLLHLKVTNAFHYTSKRSFSETSYCLFSHLLSLPLRLWSDLRSVVHVLPVIALDEARSSQISIKIKSICWVKVVLWAGLTYWASDNRICENMKCQTLFKSNMCFRAKQIFLLISYVSGISYHTDWDVCACVWQSECTVDMFVCFALDPFTAGALLDRHNWAKG